MQCLLQCCHVSDFAGSMVDGKDLGGSRCSINKLQSWHFPEGTEVINKMCQDKQCPDAHLNQASSK
jgi:hypothetical protein